MPGILVYFQPEIWLGDTARPFIVDWAASKRPECAMRDDPSPVGDHADALLESYFYFYLASTGTWVSYLAGQ